MKKFKVMMFDKLAGTLLVAEGRWVFEYEEAYLKDRNLPPISTSLPKEPHGPHVSTEIPAFFDGILPEGWLADRGKSFGIFIDKKEDAVGLYLKDTIGGVSLQEEGGTDGSEPLRKIRHLPAKDFRTRGAEELAHDYLLTFDVEDRKYQNEKLLKFAFEGVVRVRASRKCLVCLSQLTDPERAFYHPSCAEKVFGTHEDLIAETSLQTFSRDAFTSLSSGAPLPGYQPKAQFFVSTEDGSGTELIIKSDVIVDLKHKNAPRGIPVFEHLTMRAAEDFGVHTAKSAIIPFMDGSLGYATRRFDRFPGMMVHAEDMLQAKGVNQDELGKNKFEGSIRDIDAVIRKYAENLGVPHTNILKQMALRTVFNLAIGNHDAHLKNHSIIFVLRKRRGYLVNLSPAYDIITLNTMEMTKHKGRESALSINGKKTNVMPSDVIEEFKTFGGEMEAREAFEKLFARKDTIRSCLLDHLGAFGLQNYASEIESFLTKKFKLFEQNSLTGRLL